MTDHANELRRHARKIPHPQGETPGVMLRAADEIERLRIENEALRAKIEQMERQKPVRWGCTVLQVDGSWKEEIGIEEPPKDYFSIRNAFPLYALPGAQGEEK